MKKFHSLQKCLLISYLAHPKLYLKTAMEESFVFFKFINDFQYEEVSEYTKCLNLMSVMSDFMRAIIIIGHIACLRGGGGRVLRSQKHFVSTN